MEKSQVTGIERDIHDRYSTLHMLRCMEKSQVTGIESDRLSATESVKSLDGAWKNPKERELKAYATLHVENTACQAVHGKIPSNGN